MTMLGIVFIYQGQRRVPVRYPAKREVGHGMLASSTNTAYLPIQVNSAGMIPLIFAQSMLILPALLAQYLIGSHIKLLSNAALWTGTYFDNTTLWYYLYNLFAFMELFTYFLCYIF